MEITAHQALWFLVLTLPACLWAAWSDLTRMTIPNRATDMLLAVYVVAGVFLMPTWADYLWRFAHVAVVLALGMALNAARAMGAGDAKFLAGAAPFVALGDLGLVVTLYLVCLLATFALHRGARAAGGPRLAPGWASWQPGRRFPMGLALGTALPLYFLCGWLRLPAL